MGAQGAPLQAVGGEGAAIFEEETLDHLKPSTDLLCLHNQDSKLCVCLFVCLFSTNVHAYDATQIFGILKVLVK